MPPLTITALAWGFNFVAVKWAYIQVLPAAVGLARLFPTWVVMIILTRLFGEKLTYPKPDAFRILFTGFLAMGIYMVAFLEGIERTSTADAAIILASSPIITYAIAIIVRQERFRVGALFGALVAFSGVVLVMSKVMGVGGGKLEGNLLILLSAILWGISVVYSKPLMEKYSPIRVFTLSLPGALPVLIPYGLAAVATTDWMNLEPRTWLSLAHISILAGALGFAGFYVGVKHAGASGAMLAQFCVPPLATICAWKFLDEPIAREHYIGLVIVLIGVWTSAHFRRKQSPTIAVSET